MSDEDQHALKFYYNLITTIILHGHEQLEARPYSERVTQSKKISSLSYQNALAECMLADLILS